MYANFDHREITSKATQGLGLMVAGGMGVILSNWTWNSQISFNNTLPGMLGLAGIYALSSGVNMLRYDVLIPVKDKVEKTWNDTKEWCTSYSCKPGAVLAFSSVSAGITAVYGGEVFYGTLATVVGVSYFYFQTGSISIYTNLSTKYNRLPVITPDSILHFNGDHIVQYQVDGIKFSSVGAAYEAFKYDPKFLKQNRQLFEGKPVETIKSYQLALAGSNLKKEFQNPYAKDYKATCAYYLERFLWGKFGVGLTGLTQAQNDARRELLETDGVLQHPAIDDFTQEQMSIVYKDIYNKVLKEETAAGKAAGTSQSWWQQPGNSRRY